MCTGPTGRPRDIPSRTRRGTDPPRDVPYGGTDPSGPTRSLPDYNPNTE